MISKVLELWNCDMRNESWNTKFNCLFQRQCFVLTNSEGLDEISLLVQYYLPLDLGDY